MKTLVIYYSLNGNTRRMAEAMAAELGADLLPLTLVDELPTRGLRKFWEGGRQALSKEAPALRPLARNPAEYDRLLIGTPVWAGGYAPALRTFLRDSMPAGKEIALFCCHGGGKGRVFQRLRELLEPANRVCGECDFVEPLRKGEEAAVQRARAWARSLWS